MTDAEFQTAFDQHKDAVYRFAWRMSGSPAAAEDITQDVFVGLLRHPDRFDPARGPLRAFLLGIARNVTLKRWRKEHRYEPLDNEAVVAESVDVERGEVGDMVGRAVRALRPLQREVVILVEYERLTLVEVARRAHRSWLVWLVTGAIRVPVPAALAALVLAAFWTASTRLGPIAWPFSPRQTSTPDSLGPRRSGELARYALSGPLEGYDAVLVEVNFGPGVSAPEHRHSGFVLGYVVDGQARSGINHEADEIVPAGGTFFEPPGALHTAFGAARSDGPVRILAFMVVPSGSR